MSGVVIKTGLIGHPVGHSKSPLIHEYWIKQHNLSASYDLYDCAPENLEGTVHRMRAEHLRGFNVTIPHKQSVMALCDTLDETARAVGAVNTVRIDESGMHGMNTDVFGFLENLRRCTRDIDYTNAPAVILGAGGAARAAVYGLLKSGVPSVTLVNRSLDKAESLAADMAAYGAVKITPWEKRDRALAGASLLVNTTSLGMLGQPPLDLSLEHLPEAAAVYDIVYTPLMTDLLQRAHDRGHKTITGIGMLLHQARPAFQAWFGVMPDIDEALERLVLS